MTEQNAATADVLSRWTRDGWEILYRDADGVQFKKPKQWNRWRLGIFVLAPVLLATTSGWWLGPLPAVALSSFMWVLAVVSLFIQVVLYLLNKDQLRYVRADELEPGVVVVNSRDLTSDRRVVCPRCGTANKQHWDHCQKCGVALEYRTATA
jgi:hypothetical protein